MSTFTAPSVEELQSKFPQHNLESFIAKGGMGAVYLASQNSLDRPVAIKILPKEFGEDKDYRASFETEAKAMAKLNHSNLVGIYDFGDIDGMLYIIMEYIPGRSLFETADGLKVDQVEAASLISEMCDGLEHAHQAGLLHRDIKPANVLIDDEARPKIVDFGLAKPVGEDNENGVIFGTPGYTAPEVITNPNAVDLRSDIFSMGVMLYELLTGHLPGDPIVLASHVSSSDLRFDTILAKAIHPDPNMRYSTAGEMAADLRAVIQNFEQTVGLLTSGALARSPLLQGSGMGSIGLYNTRRGILPVNATRTNVNALLLKKNSGNSSGKVIGIISALVAVITVIFIMSGPENNSEPEKTRLATIEDANEKSLAEEAEIRRKAKLKSEAKLKKETEKQAKIANNKKLEAEKLEAAAHLAKKNVGMKKRFLNPEDGTFNHVKYIAHRRKLVIKSANRIFSKSNQDREQLIDKKLSDTRRVILNVVKRKERKKMIKIMRKYFDHLRTGINEEVVLSQWPAELKAEINQLAEELLVLEQDVNNKILAAKQKYEIRLSRKRGRLATINDESAVSAITNELNALYKKGYFMAIVKSKNPNPKDYTMLISKKTN